MKDKSTGKYRCLAKKTKDCAKSSNCKDSGKCVFGKRRTCEAHNSLSTRCDWKEGLCDDPKEKQDCFWLTQQCTPGTTKQCKKSLLCTYFGRCQYDGKRKKCVGTTQSCAASQVCEKKGLCDLNTKTGKCDVVIAPCGCD